MNTKRIFLKFIKLSFSAFLLSMAFSVVTHAATCYWVSDGVNPDWNLGANWSSSSGGGGSDCGATETWPDGGDDIAIFDNGSDEDVTVSIAIELDELTINSGYDGIVDMGTQNLTIDDTVTLNDGELQFSSGILQVGSGDATDDLTIETGATLDGGSGTIDVEGDWNMNGGIFWGGGGDVTIEGDFLQSNGAFNQGSSDVYANSDFEISLGTYNSTTADIDVAGNMTFSGGTFNGSTNDLQGFDVDGNVTISGGDFDLDTLDFTVGATSQLFHISGGTVDLGSRTISVDDNMRISGTANVTGSSGNFTAMGYFSMTGGSYNGNGGNMNVHGNFSITGGTYTHGNNHVYHFGDEIYGPVTLYNLDVDYSGATYYVDDVITIDNDLHYDDGTCNGGLNDKFVIKNEFSWNAGAHGGDCYIELDPTASETYTFANSDDLPVIFINDSNATVSLGASGTVTMEGLVIDAGTLNQGSVNLLLNGTLGPGYDQNGGTFNGGSGTFTCTQTWTDNDITGGSFSSGSGAVSFSRRLNINTSGDQDAQVSFATASQVDFLGRFSIGAASGSGSVTLTQNTTNVEDNLFVNASANMDPNNGTLVYKGDDIQVTETFYNFTVDPDVANDSIYTSGTVTVSNNLNWTDGSCTSSGQFVVQDGFTYGAGDGGTCRIHLDSSGTETVNIAGGQDFMRMELNSANTTVNLTGTGDTTIYELDIQDGIFNQGSVDVTSSNIMNMTGGTFTGGAGNLDLSDTDIDLENGTFTAGSGDYSFEDIFVNRSSGESGVFNLSNAGLVDVYSVSIGASGSGGSVTAPGSSSNGWRIERSFYFTNDDTSFSANGGTIIFDEDYDRGYVDVPNITLNNVRIEKDASDDDVVFDNTMDIDGNFIMEKGGLDFTSETINLAGDFINCPSNLNPADTDCVNAGASDTTMAPTGSTLNLNGTGQRMGGDNSGTFYNLIKTITSAETMYFEGGEEVRVTNQMTLTGVSGELLTLQSTNSTPAELNAESGMTVDYVKIRNVDNVRSGGDYDLRQSAKGHTENEDLGENNQGWLFDNPYVPIAKIPEFSTWIFILTMLMGMGMVQNKYDLLGIKVKN